MGQLASYCCRSDHEAVNEQIDGCNNCNYGKPCIKQELKNLKDPFQTHAPCWHGYRCECPCHRGTGPCIYKLKSK